MTAAAAILRDTLKRYRNQLVIFLTPLIALPLPLCLPGQEAQVGYVIVVMAVYWCTEAIPLPVTSFIPIFVFPMLGILDTAEITALYTTSSMVMFIGSAMVSLAIEKCNLHRRIALGMVAFVGVKPVWLMFGFMVPTWFLSLWASNTATTVLMLPIMEMVLKKSSQTMAASDVTESKELSQDSADTAAAMDASHTRHIDHGTELVEELSKEPQEVQRKEINGDHGDRAEDAFHLHDDAADNEDGRTLSAMPITEDTDGKVKNEAKDLKFAKGLSLAIAYSAIIGGTGTLIGSPVNVIMQSAADSLWQSKGLSQSPVNFTSWMVFALPASAITTLLIWLWLTLLYLGPRAFCERGDHGRDKALLDQVKAELKTLGKMRYEEWMTLFFFCTMILLLFFRSPGFISGWGDKLNPETIEDAVVTMMVALSLFVIPSRPLSCLHTPEPTDTLMNWDYVHRRFPWSVIYIIGGGTTLAVACLESGLADLVTEQLMALQSLDTWLLVFVLCIIASVFTEIVSNTSMCALLMPIVSSMAEELGLNPLYLMFPTAVACAYSFMLPGAAAPLAVVLSYRRVSVLDMIKTGVLLKAAVIVIVLATETWGMAFFQFNTPPWPTGNASDVTTAPAAAW